MAKEVNTVRCAFCAHFVEKQRRENLFRSYANHVWILHPEYLPPWVESVLDAEYYLWWRAHRLTHSLVDRDEKEVVD